MRALVWFRSDLRTRDHAALSRATREADRGVVAVFVLSPEQWLEHDWGSPKVGFVLDNLRALSADLEKLRIPLRVLRADRFAAVPGALLELARDTGCDALYFHHELEVNERRRDETVRDTFEDAGLAVTALDDVCILPPGTVKTEQDGWYTVYSPFRKKFRTVYGDGDKPPTHPQPVKQAEMACDPDSVPETLGAFPPAELDRVWAGGQNAALAALDRFVDERLAEYDKMRDYPGTESTSVLSPYLALGVISPRECFARAIEAETAAGGSGAAGPKHWADELIWRDFYKHLLVGFPRLSMGRSFRPELDVFPWRSDDDQFHAWADGRTGIPIVDAAQRQLAKTGWMHNRCRMIVAMFLSKNLLLDWRLGERHFMRHLVDADLANNNGGWQWSASTGTDAAPYFRIFNPISQSERFDPDGAYIRRYVHELRDVEGNEIHDPSPLTRASTGYPEAIVDVKRTRQRAIAAFEEFRHARVE